MLKEIKEKFENSDVLVIDLGEGNDNFCMLFMIGGADIDIFNRYYLENLKKSVNSNEDLSFKNPGLIKKIEDAEIEFELYSSNIVLITKEANYSVALPKPNGRTVQDSISEPINVFGSRDGFVEDYRVNLSLIRTRIKSNKLMLKELEIGKISKTKVSVLGIKDISNEFRFERIIKTLEKIEIDAILNITDITSFFTRKRMFPIEKYSGSPEEVAKELLEGEIVILVDRVPVSIVLPTSLFFATKLKIDAQTPRFYSLIQRFYILLCFLISVFWLGFFASLVMYQSDNLSFLLLSSLKVSQRGVIFPVFYEILGILFLFELIQLIGIRSPSTTIQNIVVIVGGILIGQNTIASGLVGVVVMTLTAFSFIAAFTITNDSRIIMSISLMRWLIFISSLFLGFIGMVLTSIVLISYIYKNKFLGISFLHPFIPFNYEDFKKFFQNRNNLEYKKRNNVLDPKNKVFKK